ncbi:MAG TPA: site-specific integrase [Planctomycetaceae bacterium]|jgi:integrase|nr:site-specific integrase [Planctomycetaceae bacterium]
MSKEKVPQYCLHKGSGQAYVKIDGRRIYLGPHNSTESRRRYSDEIDRWRELQQWGVLPDIRVGELMLTYLDKHVQKHYVKNGRATSEQAVVQAALRFLAKHRHVLSADFGPRLLKDVRADMVHVGLARETVNRYTTRIRQMFEWAVSEELIHERVLAALRTVKALLAGRTDAPDHERVKPVPIAFVNAIQPYVSRHVWGMIQMGLLTGARPGEIVSMRVGDINMSGRIWEYIPREHKMQHKEQDRLIMIGPKAQAILREFLKPNVAAYVFSPAEADRERRDRLRAERKSSMTPSQAARRPKENGQRRPKDHFTVASYRRAIERACEIAFGMPDHLRIIPMGLPADEEKCRRREAAQWRKGHCWHPNQLRHTFGTQARREGGIETSRILLGHTSIATSEIYAEPDRTAAQKMIARIG